MTPVYLHGEKLDVLKRTDARVAGTWGVVGIKWIAKIKMIVKITLGSWSNLPHFTGESSEDHGGCRDLVPGPPKPELPCPPFPMPSCVSIISEEFSRIKCFCGFHQPEKSLFVICPVRGNLILGVLLTALLYDSRVHSLIII
jgi:hypothetical protein